MLAPDALADIKLKLQTYQTAYCGLKHERVVELASPGGASFAKRYGFCDRLTRKYRLGCAHTTANEEFCRLVLSLGEQMPGIQAIAEDLDELFSYVYITDIAKGSLEKQLAFALAANNEQFITEARAAIAQVIAAHNQLIKNIEELRLQLMAALMPG
ncbi:hypothetical protein BEL04_05500 [Mucilaginibacter sp. PPCGB 2223]|uniref:hypothetical protein n=1 Tax=Mucilaginibacter sp. PPCGB 2223 TaxID=1886027 RepID=UPI0008246AE7|nr:hypothetical protein [Mucilaginibacter sp. PPCGB 2223]OCX53744.1 hypothetical protein BEL04_05500 [Mucilaginibacter sp. PPCGB 2223]